MTFWKGKAIETLERSVVTRGFGEGRGIGRAQRNPGSGSGLYAPIMVNTRPYRFLKSIEYKTSRGALITVAFENYFVIMCQWTLRS